MEIFELEIQLAAILTNLCKGNEFCPNKLTPPPPDRLKSQLSTTLRVRFSRSLCILVWSCQIRDSLRVVPELPSLSTVYGLFHPLFCHSGHQFIHCPQVHRRLKLYERQYSAISPSVLNIILSRKKLSPIVRLMVPKGCSDKHFLLSIFFSSIWSLK